jgi:hypothetical protein
MTSAVTADVVPGDVIDKTNWQKAEGLLPEPVLDWVKRGEFILNIGELDVEDPTKIRSDYVLEAFETNRDKYGIDENGGVVDKKSGELAKCLVGFPFTDLDPGDPVVVEKLMYNHQYGQHVNGFFKFRFQLIWVSERGFEREVDAQWQGASMTGFPEALKLSNSAGVEKYSILVVRKPYDLAGTAIMTHRFLDPTQSDNTFGYIPAIRRVRRMSAANRSDAFIGSDECVDDVNGYDGKVPAFDWKLIRVQEALLAFLPGVYPFVENRYGEWETTKDVKRVIYGYEKEGWQGAPWAPTNLIFAKRPVYVIEMTPRDPYYNYGTHYIWASPETYACPYKIVNDRAGQYWKSLYMVNTFVQSADKKMAVIAVPGQNVIDERYKHATITQILSPDNPWTMKARLNLDDFSMAGFQKFCK